MGPILKIIKINQEQICITQSDIWFNFTDMMFYVPDAGGDLLS